MDDRLPPTVIGLLSSRVERYPERPFSAIVRSDGIERLTYLEAGGRVAGIADWLSDQGFARGDRIAVYLDLGDPGIWFYLACAANGVVPVPLGPSYSIDALSQLVTQTRAKAILTMPELVRDVQTVGLPVLCFVRPGQDVPAGATAIGERPPVDAVARLNQLASAVEGNEIYMLQPTSGSTGVPKVVMRRHVTFPRAGMLIAAGLTPDAGGQAGLLAQALTHGGGHYCLSVALYLGGCICIPSAIDTAVDLAEVEQLSPTFLYVAPRILRSLFQQHAARYGGDSPTTPFCGSRLQWILIGGALPDESLLVELERRGVQVIEGYGATEISIISMTVRGKRRPGSAGRVVDDISVRIADNGELVAKSDYGMAGYFDNEALTRAAYTADGYYLTGDLGTIDAEGFLRIHGRARDVFNSAEGSNIYPARIEDMVEALPSVSQAVLVGDGKPFIVALVTVESEGAQPGELLSPSAHPHSYAAVRAEIAAVNAKLEAFERIRRVALFASPFPSAVHQPAGQAKIRRDRNQIVKVYREVIDALYASSSPYDEIS